MRHHKTTEETSIFTSKLNYFNVKERHDNFITKGTKSVIKVKRKQNNIYSLISYIENARLHHIVVNIAQSNQARVNEKKESQVYKTQIRHEFTLYT